MKFNPGIECASLTFHLCNIWDYIGKPIRYSDYESRAGRLEFTANDWLITIDAVDGDYSKALRKEGGYCFTHVGRITKTNGNSFLAEDANDLLNAFWSFFCFFNGWYVGKPLIVGLDSHGNRVYEEWVNPLVTSWRGVFRCIPNTPALDIEPLFQRFYDLWQISYWREVLNSAIYWYIGSNLNSVLMEGSLVSPQIALESLAWSMLVMNDKTLSKTEFNEGKNASARITMLMNRLGIPTKIPDSLSALQGYAMAKCKTDIPGITVTMRNSIVHPGKKPILKDVKVEAWLASVWCLELTILALLGYNGQYMNRLIQNNEPEFVPWAMGMANSSGA